MYRYIHTFIIHTYIHDSYIHDIHTGTGTYKFSKLNRLKKNNNCTSCNFYALEQVSVWVKFNAFLRHVYQFFELLIGSWLDKVYTCVHVAPVVQFGLIKVLVPTETATWW